MIHRLFHRGREHERRTKEINAQRERVEAQWPEVRESAAWAREVQRMNHLTELFFAGRPRGSHGNHG